MLKRITAVIVVSTFCFFASGCAALIGTALSAAAAYGVYMATKKH